MGIERCGAGENQDSVGITEEATVLKVPCLHYEIPLNDQRPKQSVRRSSWDETRLN
jgi:hypothetical protein